MRDPIERQDAIIQLSHNKNGDDDCDVIVQKDIETIKQLPSAQPEPAIPISWLEKEIERLESYENSFAVLDAVQLKALIKRWRGEQDGRNS